VNRKQREYLRRRQAEKKAAQASLNPQEQQPVKAKARALRSAEQNAMPPGPASSPTTAEESVKNWLAFRKNDKQAPDVESLNHWLAYRERQTETAPTIKSASQDRSREPDGGASGNQDSDAAERNSTHGRHNDVAL
jgi:hypothetical protein